MIAAAVDVVDVVVVAVDVVVGVDVLVVDDASVACVIAAVSAAAAENEPWT